MPSHKKVLVICNSPFASGAEFSLHELITNCKHGYEFIIVLPENSSFLYDTEHVIYHLPLKWFYFTLNPFKLYQFANSIIQSYFQIKKIIKKHQIDLIYANTTKSYIYAVTTRFFTKKKLIWHVRDNIKHTIFHKLLMKNSDMMIAVSKHIDNQVIAEEQRKRILYGGLDIREWPLEINPDKTIRHELGLQDDKILIAQAGQLTRWKNQSDFIKAAALILKTQRNVHFLIIGDDLSGREKKYKIELKKLAEKLNVSSFISFLGNRKDMKRLLCQIDILIHPAIDEPFGRVLIEAMSMEKPVIAYNCGGPIEIIVNNETGYLVTPCNYTEIAEKAILLLEDEDLRTQLGKAGRNSVLEKFNMDRYLKGIEEIFDHLQQTDS